MGDAVYVGANGRWQRPPRNKHAQIIKESDGNKELGSFSNQGQALEGQVRQPAHPTELASVDSGLCTTPKPKGRGDLVQMLDSIKTNSTGTLNSKRAKRAKKR